LKGLSKFTRRLTFLYEIQNLLPFTNHHFFHKLSFSFSSKESAGIEDLV
jgi:hypothetical protein